MFLHQVPVWTRGFERAFLLEPRENQIDMMGLFGSVAGNVTADVVVVKTWDELEEKGEGGEVSAQFSINPNTVFHVDEKWSIF